MSVLIQYGWIFMSALMIYGIVAPTHANQESPPYDLSSQSMEKPLVILGASYAAGLEAADLAGFPVINKGVGGEQSFEMLARFDADVVRHNPQIVLIWGFINDIFRSDPSRIEQTLEKTKTSFIEMVSLAQRHGIQPVLATEVTMSLKPGFKEAALSFVGRLLGRTGYQDYVNNHVMTVNRWLLNYASENNLVIFDIQTELAGKDLMRKKIYAQDDGSHISEEGYRVITTFLEEGLASLN